MAKNIESVLLSCALIVAMTGSALAATPENADYSKGSELLAKKNYQEAIASFDKAIQADAKHMEAYMDRALCNFHLGNYKKVLEDCNAVAEEKSPAHQISRRQALMMAAGAHNALGEYDEAVKSCDKALSLAPKASMVFVDRAFAYQQLKRLDEALKDCNEALKINPKLANAYQLRAQIYQSFAKQDLAKYNELNAAAKAASKTASESKKN
ncbi:MAG: tetratricopeptide repeat protein [Candidatus Obscuribacterales bacterium]|nr:tetratricopeptide repeat protein [Candidatus Obscuribacterales bacterium]